MSRTTPLTVALAVVCALLFVIGLLVAGLGGYGYAHRNAPLAAERADMDARSRQGEYISPNDYAGNMKIAAIEAEDNRTQSVKAVGLGVLFMLPLLAFGIVNVIRGQVVKH